MEDLLILFEIFRVICFDLLEKNRCPSISIDKRFFFFDLVCLYLSFVRSFCENQMEDILSGEVVLGCSSLDETVAFFVDQLGFRVQMIYPADDPSVTLLSAYGLNIRLERNDAYPSLVTLRLLVKENSLLWKDQRKELIAPNGTKIELIEEHENLSLPPIEQSLVITKKTDESGWIKGRAGMFYRDLIPGRQGGRFIASHIKILDGGPIADHVHYHQIRFQMIYIYKGWVRLLYEDQGGEFVLHEGDCVLQPPFIRHRVLESSSSFQAIEIASPAIHPTFLDHQMKLPNGDQPKDRLYHQQSFLKYLSNNNQSETSWKPWRIPSFECQDTGIGQATNGLASVQIVRYIEMNQLMNQWKHQAEFVFIFILNGQLTLKIDEEQIHQLLKEEDALVLPSNLFYSFENCSKDLQFLEVTLPQSCPTNVIEKQSFLSK